LPDGIVDFKIQIKGSDNRCIGKLSIGDACIESCRAQPAFSLGIELSVFEAVQSLLG
jgi:hypothetical protein